MAKALAAIGASLRASPAWSVHGAPICRTELLDALDLDEDAEAHNHDLGGCSRRPRRSQIGDAGDRVKYEAAARSMVRRWQLYRAIADIDDATAPTRPLDGSSVTPLFLVTPLSGAVMMKLMKLRLVPASPSSGSGDRTV